MLTQIPGKMYRLVPSSSSSSGLSVVVEVVVVEVVVEVLDTGMDRTRSILWPGDCSQSAGTVSSTSGLIISPAGEMLEEAGRRVSVTNLSSRESCRFPK